MSLENEVNTTTRFHSYCRAKAEDGRICSLYSQHYGKHKEKHLRSEWEDGE